MRRVLKAVTLDGDPGDISTIEDEGSVEEARHAWQDMREQVRGSRARRQTGGRSGTRRRDREIPRG